MVIIRNIEEFWKPTWRDTLPWSPVTDEFKKKNCWLDSLNEKKIPLVFGHFILKWDRANNAMCILILIKQHFVFL